MQLIASGIKSERRQVWPHNYRDGQGRRKPCKVRGLTVGVIHHACESVYNTVACTNKLTTTSGAAESSLRVVRLRDGCRIADTRGRRAQCG